MKSIRICLALAVVGLIGSLASCGSKDPAPTPTLKFTTTAATYAEDIGTISVEVTLSAKQSSAVTFNYNWTSPDTTAFYGGDFTITSPTTITIPAGETTANITVAVIDDLQLDGDKNTVQLTIGTATNAVASSTDKTFTLTIENDDEAIDGRMQTDLYWFPGASATADINTVDLDIALMENVVYHWEQDNGGTWHAILDDQGDVYTSSDAVSGFETMYLNQEDKDQTYFLYVIYAGGSGAVNFATLSSGLNYLNGLSGSFTADQAPNSQGTYFKYAGPYSKTGDTFAYVPHSGRASSAKAPIDWQVGRMKTVK